MATITAGYSLLVNSATAYSSDVMALIREIHLMPDMDPRKGILEDALSRSIHTLMCGLSDTALISTVSIR